jgi:hypothetical protein
MVMPSEIPGKRKDPKSLLEFYAGLIERKFANGDLYDIDPETIKKIIGALKSINPGKDKSVPALLQEIEMTCYAAIRYYKDGKYEPYMKRLPTIARMVRNLLRMIK